MPGRLQEQSQCERCGSAISEGSHFCSNCGMPLGYARRDMQGILDRPVAVGRFAWGNILAAMIDSFFLAFTFVAFSNTGVSLWLAAGLVLLFLATIHILTATGLWHMKNWGRILQVAIGWMMLPLLPFGTFVGIYCINYFSDRTVRLLFKRRSAEELTGDEMVAIIDFRESTTAVPSLVVSGVFVVTITLVIGAMVAVFIPNYNDMQQRSSDGRLKALGHTVQLAVEVCAMGQDGYYPLRVVDFLGLLPGGRLLDNPCTGQPVEPRDWSPEDIVDACAVYYEPRLRNGLCEGYWIHVFDADGEILLTLDSGP